jgi:toxin ParE2
MRVIILRVARIELREAYENYQAEREGLGLRFLKEVRRTIDFVRRFPNAAPSLGKPYRRCRLHRFPYGIVYEQAPDELRVVAVMHFNRRPNYWRDRLK